jgi:hypothetical protein
MGGAHIGCQDALLSVWDGDAFRWQRPYALCEKLQYGMDF